MVVESAEDSKNPILPKVIAERLKSGERTIANGHPIVTVMFSDLAGFTALSRRTQPADLVGILNGIFTTDLNVENDPVQLAGGNGYIWFEALSSVASRERPLDEVRDRVIERWRLLPHAEFGQVLDVDVLFDDPETFTEPAHGHGAFKRSPPGVEVGGYNCADSLWDDFVKRKLAGLPPPPP